MITKKIFYSVLTALLLVTGCGSSGSNDNDASDNSPQSVNAGDNSPQSVNTTIETTKGVYKYKVINNRGEEVQTKVDKYTIAIYSDTKEKAYDKSPHKGIVVKLNNKDSELMAIQSTYLGKDIVAKVYKDDKLLLTSDVVNVTDENPVVLIDVEI